MMQKTSKKGFFKIQPLQELKRIKWVKMKKIDRKLYFQLCLLLPNPDNDTPLTYKCPRRHRPVKCFVSPAKIR